jgi:hypothetical protein
MSEKSNTFVYSLTKLSEKKQYLFHWIIVSQYTIITFDSYFIIPFIIGVKLLTGLTKSHHNHKICMLREVTKSYCLHYFNTSYLLLSTLIIDYRLI